MALTAQVIQTANDHIFKPAALAWQPPPHLKATDQLRAWTETFVRAIAELSPTEDEAKAAFLLVAQTYDRAHWPPAAAFCKAIREARADRGIAADSKPNARDYAGESLWFIDEKGNRQLNHAAFDRRVKAALADVVDAWLHHDADWVDAFLATFPQQRTDPPVTRDNFAHLSSLPATDRDMAHWHLVEILKRKAWLRAQRDVLGQPVDPLQLTEGDVTIIRERIASQPYERHGRYIGSR